MAHNHHVVSGALMPSLASTGTRHLHGTQTYMQLNIHTLKKKKKPQEASEMDQGVKATATKPNNLSSFPRTHMVEKGTTLSQTVLWHTYHTSAHVYTHTCMYVHKFYRGHWRWRCGSLGKSICCQAWGPAFSPQDPYLVKGQKQSQKLSPDLHTCTVMCIISLPSPNKCKKYVSK